MLDSLLVRLIDNLAYTLGLIAKEVKSLMGQKMAIVFGGPSPKANGEIVMQTLYAQTCGQALSTP